MNWREMYGIADKPRKRCPVCGMESTGGRRCGYHASSGPAYAEAVRNRRHALLLRRVLVEAIEEARA